MPGFVGRPDWTVIVRLMIELISGGERGEVDMSFIFGALKCPDCGKRFNWLDRAVGQYKAHMRSCPMKGKGRGHIPFSTGCRGCPAGCYERGEDAPEGRK